MISLNVLFWLLVFLFAMIGAIRGWAKEILVSFSVILGIFIIQLLETYVAPVRSTIVDAGGIPLFWLRAAIIGTLVFFGYQTPNIGRIQGARFAREHLQDGLLGLIIGAFNAYLIFGTLWYFLDNAQYPFTKYINTLPGPGDPMGDAARRLIAILPPHFLGVPWIFLAIAVSFLFVIVVFI
jgi:hypothetical protein